MIKEDLLGSLRFLRKVLTPSLLAAIQELLPGQWIGSFQACTRTEDGESVSVDIVPTDSQPGFQFEIQDVNGADSVLSDYFSWPYSEEDPETIRLEMASTVSRLDRK